MSAAATATLPGIPTGESSTALLDSGLGGEPLPLHARLKAGDRQAFEELVREQGGRLLAVARRFLRSSEDQADAVQETFLSALRSIGSFEGGSSISTWLHRILINHCLMKLRTRSRRHEVSLEDVAPRLDGAERRAAAASTSWAEDPHARLATAEERVLVRRRIECLPDSLRLVLLLRDIEELDTDETARLLGISRANVKTRLHRARLAVRELLEPHFEELQ